MHPILGSLLASAATNGPIIREGIRTKPVANSAGQAEPALKKALSQRIKDIGGEKQYYPPALDVKGYEPKTLQDVYRNPQMLGGNQRVYGLDDQGQINQSDYKGDRIFYNKNANPEVLAHELGHTATATTKVGHAMRHLRDNPKLAMALAAATGVLPLGAAVLTPGDDDYDEAILGTMALAAPTLIDEGLATKNALAMMDTAGMRATMGQRGRLAGGLLSYVAAPMATATFATALGNQFDEDVPPGY